MCSYICLEVAWWCWFSAGGLTHGSDQILSSSEKRLLWSGWLLGGTGSGVRMRRKERLMASLKWGFLWLIRDCLGQVGWFFKASLLIGLACPVEKVTEWWSGEKTADCLWLASSNSSFIHSPVSSKSLEASCKWKGSNMLSVGLNTQQLSLSNEDMKRPAWIEPNPQILLCYSFENEVKCHAKEFGQRGNMLTHKTWAFWCLHSTFRFV